ncbi:MAG: dihydropteroate synthase [Candidatus Omnitrophica bacterium]|nr:dihydropteroate synthase [Candidatus Omnitrophota bacterium]
MIRVLEISSPKELNSILREIKVDPYGIDIMRLKGLTRLIHIKDLSNITANILKQEMLSLGADAAIARNALTGKTKITDCLLMGNDAQLFRLKTKLKNQPFGLGGLANRISQALGNYESDGFLIETKKYRLDLTKATRIMGVMNLTPDSFSGDGLYASLRALDKEKILAFAQKLVNEGADILDIGGESSRPGAKPISIKEECARVIPAIKLIAKRVKVPISIDTYKPEVASRAIDCGVSLINDITGLRDPAMVKLAARSKAAVVIMHMKGMPYNMQKSPVYKSLIFEINSFLESAITRAVEAGVARDKIIIDPGIGFGKTMEHNLEILKNLRTFKTLGRPILVGPSRKSFIGKILRSEPQARIPGTISACVLAAKNGANLLRVHDVKEVKQALKIFDAVNFA